MGLLAGGAVFQKVLMLLAQGQRLGVSDACRGAE